MSNANEIDMEYRPRSYWVYEDVAKRVGATVKGTVRRLVAEAGLEGDPVGETDPFCLDEALPEEERAIRSRMHPSFMGGEYLPDLLPGEVEIARVSYASVTSDVVSVRARWEDGKIRYRVVDEYEDEYPDDPIVCPVESSDLPLTLDEIIDLIDGTEYRGAPDLILSALQGPVDEGADPEDYRNFITVTSPFYPALEAYFDAIVAHWYENAMEQVRELRGEDEDDLWDEERWPDPFPTQMTPELARLLLRLAENESYELLDQVAVWPRLERTELPYYVSEEILEGAVPPERYAEIQGGAALTEAELDILEQHYVESLASHDHGWDLYNLIEVSLATGGSGTTHALFFLAYNGGQTRGFDDTDVDAFEGPFASTADAAKWLLGREDRYYLDDGVVATLEGWQQE